RQERVLKAISGFQSRESYRRPPALMTAFRHVTPAEGVTLASAWGPQHPAARLMPAAGFFRLTQRRRKGGCGPHESAAKVGGKTDDCKITPLPGTKRAALPLGVHAALFRRSSGRRDGRPCRTSLHVLRGRRTYCVRLVLRDAADPRGEPWSRRLQSTATDGHYLHGAADIRARGDHARCRGGAG